MSKGIGGWLFGDRLYLSANVAKELWYVHRKQGEKQTHLFFVGWYSHPDRPKARLYSVTILWASFKFGFSLYSTKEPQR